MPCANDNKLIQIVDAAVAEAVHNSGDRVVCRPGCFECCIGVFPIAQSDVLRLRRGLHELERTDPVRAAHLSSRVKEAADRLVNGFPGNTATGLLGENAVSQELFENFADEEPCPVLDRATGTCDLYAWRPMTCRTFGPAIRLNSDSVDICELNYRGASEDEILACEVELQTSELEADAEREAESVTHLKGRTIVAFGLARAT